MSFNVIKGFKEAYSGDYKAMGSFYKFTGASPEHKGYRNLLEIYSLQYFDEVFPEGSHKSCDDILHGASVPDALFVMMNPGGSKPSEGYAHSFISEGAIVSEQLSTINMIPTVVDDTQFILMDAMRHRCWNCIRIINLSDVSESDSKKFQSQLLDDGSYQGSLLHSIFSEQRKCELELSLSIHPIILAWGSDCRLDGLINIAWEYIKPLRPIGWAKHYYYHPYQRKEEKLTTWLCTINDQLDELTSPSMPCNEEEIQ
ncbi:MAG: hypothetical protein ACYDBB_04920 [Armatimonadota bacterium]